MSEPSPFSLGQTWQKPPADLWVIIAKLDYRVRELEKALHHMPQHCFSFPGSFTTGFGEIVARERKRHDLPEMAAVLYGDGSTATEGTVYRNGATLWDFVIPSGELEVVETGFASGDRGAYYTVEVTSVGTGALGLSVFVYTVATE